MKINNNRGQSTVEYVLLVTAVVAVMIAFATNNGTGIQQHLNTTLSTAATQMNTMAETLKSSTPQSSSAGFIENTYRVPVCPPGSGC